MLTVSYQPYPTNTVEQPQNHSPRTSKRLLKPVMATLLGLSGSTVLIRSLHNQLLQGNLLSSKPDFMRNPENKASLLAKEFQPLPPQALRQSTTRQLSELQTTPKNQQPNQAAAMVALGVTATLATFAIAAIRGATSRNSHEHGIEMTNSNTTPTNESNTDAEIQDTPREANRQVHQPQTANNATENQRSILHSNANCQTACLTHLNSYGIYYMLVGTLLGTCIGTALGYTIVAKKAQEISGLEGDEWKNRFVNSGLIFGTLTGFAIAPSLFWLRRLWCTEDEDTFRGFVFSSPIPLTPLCTGIVGLAEMLSGDPEKYSMDSHAHAVRPGDIWLTAALSFLLPPFMVSVWYILDGAQQDEY